MAKISVVILTARRRDETLARGLAALAAGELRPDEVVLVETVAGAGELSLRNLPLRRVPSHEGSFAEARNAGVREAKGEFIAFMDDDCEPDAHWLSRLHDVMLKNELAAVGGNVFPAEEFDPPVTYSPDLAWAVGCNPPGFFSSLAGRLHLPNTSSLMAERELLLRLPFQTVAAKKGDDEEGSWSYETGREDAQWWRAVRLAGERCGVAPRAIVWHHISADRFDRDVIRERIANDGRAHWNRTHNVAEIQDAARDVVNAPFVALREIFSTPHEGARTWEKHLAWALRQAAFINAATNDFDRGISPMARTRTYATEGARVVLSGMKAAARHLARNAFHAFRRTAPVPTMDEPPRRAMVVLHDFLGDAVLALPMLRQLALALDETRITVVTGGVCAPLLRENVAGNVKVVEVPDNARGRNPLACIHLYKFLAAFHPDVVLVAYCHGLAPLPFFLLDHAPVVGWREDNGFGQRTWGDLLAARVRKNFRKAECAALLDLLAPLGIGTSLQRPAVKFSAAAGDRATRIAGKANTRPGEYVVVHFEAGNRWKLWPSEKMAAVVRELLADNVTVFLVGSRRGRVEAERQRLLRLPGCFSLHNDLNSDELAAILGGAALFVGCDSGPAHVAQAVGTRTVLLFGGTEPHRWGPLGGFDGADSGKNVVLMGGQGDWLVEESRGLPVNAAMDLLGKEAVIEVIRASLLASFSAGMGGGVRK